MRTGRIYWVMILNQRTGHWRRLTVESMANAIRLTLGLTTKWEISRWDEKSQGVEMVGYKESYLEWTCEAYKHGLRALKARGLVTC